MLNVLIPAILWTAEFIFLFFYFFFTKQINRTTGVKLFFFFVTYAILLCLCVLYPELMSVLAVIALLITMAPTLIVLAHYFSSPY